MEWRYRYLLQGQWRLVASGLVEGIHVRPLEEQFLQDLAPSLMHLTLRRWQASQARFTADEDEDDDSGMV